MPEKFTAKVVPFSSITGASITLHNEDGAVIGQLQLRGFHPDPTSPMPVGEPYRTAAVALCDRVAIAINAGQPEHQVKHLKRGSTYDVMASAALFQASNTVGIAGPGAYVLRDGDPVTVYRNNELSMTFVRVPPEVEDRSRFERL